ncbi:hypothetical protein GCM10011331_09450 [Flavimobilis marinus]|uniref:DivIVA domain-containing protein n=1 Tax=Flavimobilis marinus TaxID=285351 RepID=A0A1I2CB57_9MICO|nr:DivIVA domain-containing protein [Flavimobilis marinus]GHG48008.1 hypothetical protein GCM10011331_09450 [Flavimobilis marinus]SFE65494.1 DivIVA domain-containing protein [Flavimobilis marinus]
MIITSAALRATRFHVTRFREGYDISEVDAFLGRLAATLDALETGRSERAPVTTDELLHVRFASARMSAGYDVVEVDDLLDMGLEALRQHAGVATEAESVEAVVWAPAPAAVTSSAGAAPAAPSAPGAPAAMACSAVARELSLAQATSYGENRDVLMVVGPDGTRWTASSVSRTDAGIVLTVG